MDKIRIISVFFISSLFIFTARSCTSDSTESLGNGYFYRDEGGDIKDILSKNPNGVEIPSTILDYAYNDTIILAKQKPKLPQDPLYKKTYQYNDKNQIYYWIVIKEDNINYGPLNKREYKALRKKLNIPINLQLK